MRLPPPPFCGALLYRIGALVILGGESLLNDATALLIYRGAILAAAGTWTGLSALPVALGAVLCSVVVGIALGAVVLRLLRRIADLPTAVISQFASTIETYPDVPRECGSPH